nr:PREDICTED: tetratricopeptide repeat protein 4 isoform X2 [Lepisosteus oculatus]
MALQTQGDESDDGMDEFMDKFAKQKYKGALNENNWEEEFDRIPMFMKKAPQEIDPLKNPELACLQSIIYDDDRPLEEQAKTYKEEGNEYFKERKYKKAIVSYTEGLKKKCSDTELNAILYTNRAASHFHLGNIRSALLDVQIVRKLKPDHLKALMRGAQCLLELRSYGEALQWCEEGLKVDPQDRTLQELRVKADQLRRAAERDARKARAKEKKERSEREALLSALRERNIRLLTPELSTGLSSDDEKELSLDGLSSENATGARVFLDEQQCLHWPVLFLYPEYRQTDFISAFSESARFVDHLTVMFVEELPPWDADRKYYPHDLQLYFEDEEKEEFYQISLENTLLEVLQHDRMQPWSYLYTQYTKRNTQLSFT